MADTVCLLCHAENSMRDGGPPFVCSAQPSGLPKLSPSPGLSLEAFWLSSLAYAPGISG